MKKPKRDQDDVKGKRATVKKKLGGAATPSGPAISGLTGWLIAKLGRGERPKPRIELVERIALAPRQSLALVVAEGQRILVATSAEGGPAFYPLGESSTKEKNTTRTVRPARPDSRRPMRVSW